MLKWLRQSALLCVYFVGTGVALRWLWGWRHTDMRDALWSGIPWAILLSTIAAWMRRRSGGPEVGALSRGRAGHVRGRAAMAIAWLQGPNRRVPQATNGALLGVMGVMLMLCPLAFAEPYIRVLEGARLTDVINQHGAGGAIVPVQIGRMILGSAALGAIGLMLLLISLASRKGHSRCEACPGGSSAATFDDGAGI